MKPTPRDVGIHWEDAAATHLRQAGLEPVARNFSCRYGEIDLVMLDRTGLDRNKHDKSRPDRSESIVFVEVRYRNIDARGDGLASVGAAKRSKLLRAAAVYLQEHPKLADMPCRFDIVSCGGTLERPSFDWIRAAFDAC